MHTEQKMEMIGRVTLHYSVLTYMDSTSCKTPRAALDITTVWRM